MPRPKEKTAPEAIVAARLIAFPQVERIILFGSRARGEEGFRADIDLAVDCPTADSQGWSDIVEAAEEAPTLLKLDLVRLDRAPKELADAIRNEGRVLYERTDRKAQP